MEKASLEQKQIMMAHKLLPDNWTVEEETEQELVVRFRHGKTVKRLKKGINLWKQKTREER